MSVEQKNGKANIASWKLIIIWSAWIQKKRKIIVVLYAWVIDEELKNLQIVQSGQFLEGCEEIYLGREHKKNKK